MSSTGEEISTQNFGIIEWYDYNRKASGFVERLKYLDIKLSDWLFRAIDAAEVLPINRDYFRIRRPIDRRVYEIARKHCGKQMSWKVSVGLLQKKCGSRQAEKHFVAHLRELVASNALPDYDVALDLGFVVFTRRDGKPIELAKPPAPVPVPTFVEEAPQSVASSFPHRQSSAWRNWRRAGTNITWRVRIAPGPRTRTRRTARMPASSAG